MFSLFQRACSLACGVLQFPFASFVLRFHRSQIESVDSTKSLCSDGLSYRSANNVRVWLRTLILICFVFVLETIRTGAMRVIHVIVKTEETQKLRMKFVLYCTT